MMANGFQANSWKRVAMAGLLAVPLFVDSTNDLEGRYSYSLKNPLRGPRFQPVISYLISDACRQSSARAEAIRSVTHLVLAPGGRREQSMHLRTERNWGGAAASASSSKSSGMRRKKCGLIANCGAADRESAARLLSGRREGPEVPTALPAIAAAPAQAE
jgi:hypothetical protein